MYYQRSAIREFLEIALMIIVGGILLGFSGGVSAMLAVRFLGPYIVPK